MIREGEKEEFWIERNIGDIETPLQDLTMRHAGWIHLQENEVMESHNLHLLIWRQLLDEMLNITWVSTDGKAIFKSENILPLVNYRIRC